MNPESATRILGIETSCDETALALIEVRRTEGRFECRIMASLIRSQADLHSPYGGVFPTLAKREHEEHLPILLDQLIEQTRPTGQTEGRFKIDAIAVTEGPGLEPALWTGIVFAEKLAKEWDVPIIPVNHMEGHIVGSLLESDAPTGEWRPLKHLPAPALAFLISGGHTELVRIQAGDGQGAPFAYTVIGATKDDAVGEAFDKVARLLGLPYPGGPRVSLWAQEAREAGLSCPVKLPRPMIHSKDLAFSFSGLKTAVLYALRDAEKAGIADETFKRSLAMEFEDAVVETLSSKLDDALQSVEARALVIGGGVSANSVLRDRFSTLAQKHDIPIYLPSKHVSGDNALMIALAGALRPIHSDKLRAHGTKKLGTG